MDGMDMMDSRATARASEPPTIPVFHHSIIPIFHPPSLPHVRGRRALASLLSLLSLG